jgi:hypothetical protein
VKPALIGVCMIAFSLPLCAQIQLGDARSLAHKGHVVLLTESLSVEAGKPQVVELSFRVEQGFHVNSHAPKDELLIPTGLNLDAANGAKVISEDYQKGSTFRLSAGGTQGETLDVYQGEFRVSVRVVVPKGASNLTGSLRYQACDSAACFPPKTLPVNLVVTGK